MVRSFTGLSGMQVNDVNVTSEVFAADFRGFDGKKRCIYRANFGPNHINTSMYSN
jgi:hypothetical protein